VQDDGVETARDFAELCGRSISGVLTLQSQQDVPNRPAGNDAVVREDDEAGRDEDPADLRPRAAADPF